MYWKTLQRTSWLPRAAPLLARAVRPIFLFGCDGGEPSSDPAGGRQSAPSAAPSARTDEAAPAPQPETLAQDPSLESSVSPSPTDAQFRLTQAKDFELEIYGGGKARLSEQLEEGPLILDFWATWCAPCKRAFPRYQELVRAYQEYGVALWAVNQDDPRMYEKIGTYFESQGFDFPALLDPGKRVARAYNVISLPTTFILASDGEILYQHTGFRDGDEKTMETILRRSLELTPLDSGRRRENSESRTEDRDNEPAGGNSDSSPR